MADGSTRSPTFQSAVVANHLTGKAFKEGSTERVDPLPAVHYLRVVSFDSAQTGQGLSAGGFVELLLTIKAVTTRERNRSSGWLSVALRSQKP